jgi:hypothetical protein
MTTADRVMGDPGAVVAAFPGDGFPYLPFRLDQPDPAPARPRGTVGYPRALIDRPLAAALPPPGSAIHRVLLAVGDALQGARLGRVEALTDSVI